MHQIRVHLAASGWPIVGDPTYGEPRWRVIEDQVLAGALRAFPRQALHAWRVCLTHPVTGRPFAIEAPLPDDMRTLIAQTGLLPSRQRL
jgi:23S rRNA pseudouridine1911/1915/1917 synthase